MKVKKIIVLNYHLISREPVPSTFSALKRFSLNEREFISQMELIRQLKIPVVPIELILSDTYCHDLAVAFTFDDGNISDYEIVFPILQSFQFTAAFFPVTDMISSQGKITWPRLSELAANNFTIGSHGISHTALTKLSPEQKKHEIRNSKLLLEKKLNCRIKYFSAPFGLYDKETIRMALEAGYSSILTTRKRPNKDPGKHSIIDRWNVSENISAESLNDIFSREGNLPFGKALFSPITETGKRFLGSRFVNKIINYQFNNRK